MITANYQDLKVKVFEEKRKITLASTKKMKGKKLNLPTHAGVRLDLRNQKFPLKQAQKLQAEGQTFWQIAKQLKFTPKTVEKYLTLGCIPSHGNHGNLRASQLDRYRKAIEEELSGEKVNLHHIYLKLQKLGFTGIYKTVRAYVLSRYPEVDTRRKRVNCKGKPIIFFQQITYKGVVWFLLDRREEKPVEDMLILETIRKNMPVLWEARELVWTLIDLFKARDLKGFLAWVDTVMGSEHESLKRYVRGLKKDWDAVLNSFKYAYSNGPVEGHVNRLKCIKRQMYGRAKFDLLRLKVLFQGC